MKHTSLLLTTAAIMAIGSPSIVPAGNADSHVDTVSADAAQNAPGQSGNDTSDFNSDSADLHAELAAARARLESAAHEVAELAAQESGPLMEKFMQFSTDGPPRAVIGVQLDTHSGKEGARVQEVSPGGPAAEAGVHVGDVITAVNGKDVDGDEPARSVLHLMRDVAPDSKVKLRVLREGKPREFVVTARPGMAFMAMRPPRPPSPPELPGAPFGGFGFSPPGMIHGPLSEMELATLTPQLGRYFGTDKGVLVVRAPKDGDFKLEDGDVILAIDGRAPVSGSHATRILSSYQPGEKIAIKVMREHKALNVETTLPESRFMGTRPGHVLDRKRLEMHSEGDPPI